MSGEQGQKVGDLVLAQPRGFCAGVVRAIEIAEKALEKFGTPLYVRHELVHNTTVVRELEARGVIFVDQVHQIPEGRRALFSAHGVSDAVREDADAQGLEVYDATCPLVTKVHMQVKRYARAGNTVVLVGHAGHPEVEGTLGQTGAQDVVLVETREDAETLEVSDPEKVAVVTQTTLSVSDTRHIIDALLEKFPKLQQPKSSDICYATENRQNAVKQLALECRQIVVVGSQTSSNSNRLVEIAQSCGAQAWLVDHSDLLPPELLDSVQTIGITAGASAPEALVQGVVEILCKRFGGRRKVRALAGKEEAVHFHVPKALRKD